MDFCKFFIFFHFVEISWIFGDFWEIFGQKSEILGFFGTQNEKLMAFFGFFWSLKSPKNDQNGENGPLFDFLIKKVKKMKNLKKVGFIYRFFLKIFLKNEKKVKKSENFVFF